MNLVTTTLTLDPEVIASLKGKNVNISKTVRDFLKIYNKKLTSIGEDNAKKNRKKV